MKNIQTSVFILLFMVGWSSYALAQTEINCKSDIKKVSVFREQAQIEREAKVAIGLGLHTLVFEKISPTLVEGSVEVKAPDGIEILSVAIQNTYLEKGEIPAEILLIKDSLEAVKEKLFDIHADKEAILLQRELLLANKNIGGSNQGVKADELEDVLGIYQKKLQEFKVNQMALNREQKNYGAIREVLHKQLDDFESGSVALNRKLLVQVKANRAIPEAQFGLTYLVTNVNWMPSYDIRVNDQLKEVQFVLKATIQQLTGEDWKEIHMVLTTADPLSGGTKPELQPVYIQYQRPKNIDGFNAYRGNVYKTEVADSVSSTLAWVSDKAITQQNSTNLAFDIQGLSSVPSDGKYHLVELNRFAMPASYARMAIPKIHPNVFVTAKVQTNDLINQLNGEANIYLNGTFTGTTFLGQQAGDSLLITLGKDNRMLVKREKVKEMCSKSFFGSNRKESNTIEIQITNSGNEAIGVSLEDQVPLSSKEEIVVKLTDAGGANHFPESGMLRWQLQIPAKQTIKLRFSFEVSYPADKTIEGY